MKKIFALLLAAALCLTACAAGEDVLAEPEAGFSAPVMPVELAPVSQTVPGEAPEPVWTAAGAAFSLLQDTYPVGTTQLTLVVENQGSSMLEWGNWEIYEKYVDGHWQKLEGMDEIAFRDMLFCLEPLSVCTKTLVCLKLLPYLEEGLYRVTGGSVFMGGENVGAWQVSVRVSADAQPEPDYALYISSQPVPAAEGCAVLEYLPVYCINNTGENGSALFIPRLEMQDGDGAWTEVPFKEGIGFCGMSDPLPTGVTQVSENIPLLWGSLEEGRYRISYALGPDAALDPDAQWISGEFTVCTPENSGGLPPAVREWDSHFPFFVPDMQKNVVISAGLYYTKGATFDMGGPTMKSTWRFVMKIVGLSLALAGLICLVIGFWDKLAEDAAAVADKVHCKRCPEFDDYDDDLLCE